MCVLVLKNIFCYNSRKKDAISLLDTSDKVSQIIRHNRIISIGWFRTNSLGGVVTKLGHLCRAHPLIALISVKINNIPKTSYTIPVQNCVYR